MIEGRVTKSTGSWYNVKIGGDAIIKCRIRGKIRLKGIEVTNPVAVGDIVHVQMEDENQGIIHDIQPRQNYLIRRSTRKARFGHILAANIDQAVLVATLTFPKTSLGFIDRFLVAAESFRIPQLLVFNKSDLYDQKMLKYIDHLMDTYEKIDVGFLLISATEEKNLDHFKQKLQGKISLIAGHSGVGKSTILNKISPETINQEIGDVSTFANKGTHTTTFAEMFEIDQNSYVVDTPGIKELGLIDLEEGEISHFFPEMRSFFGKCKFYNCTHMHEPGCAVRLAVDEGKIAASRYYSYLSIMEEEDTHR